MKLWKLPACYIKRMLFCILVMLAAFNARAQKLRFSDTANKWRVHIKHFGDNGFNYTSRNYAYKDTIILIQGLGYKALALDLTSSFGQIAALIREDTVAGKVYIRKWANNEVGNGIKISDTGDVLLYDYTLGQGDTLLLPLSFSASDTFRSMHILRQKDSILINGVMHTVQYFDCRMGPGYPLESYTVIEGIGSLSDPVSPAPHNNFEVSFLLNCFRNGGSISPVSVFNGWDMFDNGCRPLADPGIALPGRGWTLYPNPATDRVLFRFKGELPSGSRIMVMDILGKIVYSGSLKSGFRLSVEGWPAGLYLVALYDKGGKQELQKLIVQPGQH